MVDHPRLALGSRRLAVHAGAGRTARGAAGGEVVQRTTQIRSSPRACGGSSTPRLPGQTSSRAMTVCGRALRAVEELQRVNRRRSFADLEVKLRRAHLTRLTRFGNDLAALDG